MSLTNTKIQNAKPTTKAYRLFDEKALYLEVTPTGGKYWRWKYRFNGKEKRLALGVYPEVSLKKAREGRDQARNVLAEGMDPSVERKKAAAKRADTFEAVAREWYESRKGTWSASYAERVLSRLARLVFPYVGARPIAEITSSELLEVLQRIRDRGIEETARRVRDLFGQIFRHAIATDRAQYDPVSALRGLLGPVERGHFPALTEPADVGGLLRAIESYRGTAVVTAALRLASYVFVRPGELRYMRWEDLDLEAGEWRYMASKTHTERLVPLSWQAVSIIEKLRPLTGDSVYVFRSPRSHKPISDMALMAGLRRLEIPPNVHTMHGWRATARTLLHEHLHFDADVIEHQLGHKVPDRLGQAYNRTRFLDERRRMMQEWADYLDSLRSGGRVVALNPMRSRR